VYKQNKPLSVLTAAVLLACAAQASASVTNPAKGALLWSEEFNGPTLNRDLWTPTDGNGCEFGLCGFGNAELEYYSPNNVSVVDVPGQPGVRALALKALRQATGGNAFTSGKIDSAGKVQVQYGIVEIRMSAPTIDTGLWPAAWMLGTSPQVWPRKGEIDIMEMGAQAAGRAAAGSPTPAASNFVGSNVITYQTAACVPGNESCAASTAWQTKNWYVAPPQSPLANKFVIYRLYWLDTEMRFTVTDEFGEHDLYDKPLPVNSPALKAPYYLLFNLAVGGNFTDAKTPEAVTAPLPATMYVDYVRVYQLDGKGSVKIGNQVAPEVGKFGAFTDYTPVDNKQEPGTGVDVLVTNPTATVAGTLPPFEGANVIAMNYKTPGQRFGVNLNSHQVHDMSKFAAQGTVSFKAKIPANVAFKVGIADTAGHQNSVTFPANTKAFGMVRNGEWATATIPVAQLAGANVALNSLVDLFEISSDTAHLPRAAFQFAVDDIVWDSGVPAGPRPTTELIQTSATHLTFNVNQAGWAKVRYSVNGGIQQTLTMHHAGTGNTYSIGGLAIGNVVKYSFEYWDGARNAAVETAEQTYTMR
jgi:beta-glucanase (GH16 family)